MKINVFKKIKFHSGWRKCMITNALQWEVFSTCAFFFETTFYAPTGSSGPRFIWARFGGGCHKRLATNVFETHARHTSSIPASVPSVLHLWLAVRLSFPAGALGGEVPLNSGAMMMTRIAVAERREPSRLPERQGKDS